MEREACVCDHGFERSDLCAEIIIIITLLEDESKYAEPQGKNQTISPQPIQVTYKNRGTNSSALVICIDRNTIRRV